MIRQGRSAWWDAHAAAFMAEHPLASRDWKAHSDDMRRRRNAAIQAAIDSLEGLEPPMTPEEEEQAFYAPPEEKEQTLF